MKYLVLVLFLTSCFKTTEQVKREQMLADIPNQVGQNQQVVADLKSRLDEQQTKIDQLNGKIEELEHNANAQSKTDQMNMETNVKQLQEEVSAMKVTIDAHKTEMKQLSQMVEQQKEFIQKVTKSLGAMGASAPRKSRYNEANALFDKGHHSEAHALYLEILGTEKITPAQTNLVYYNMGQIEFEKKNYDEAMVYLSKIVTQYPKSSYASKSMLLLARCFKQKDAKAEAKEAYQAVLKNYPKTKEAEAAEKEVNEI